MMFIKASGRKDVRVISRSLQATCVPLEAVEGYRQVFRSLDQENGSSGPNVVQIFEFQPQDRPGV